MVIKRVAQCDGPGCDKISYNLPSDFIVIKVEQSRGEFNRSTGQYTFCSIECLTRWISKKDSE